MPGSKERGDVMETKHTPGPWFAVNNGVYWEVGTSPDKYSPKIGDVCSSKHRGKNECPVDGLLVEKANAYIFAAAPELLEALEELRSAAIDLDQDEEGSVNLLENAIRKARLAIEKARGK
jgi:hypothetical protein